MFGGLCFMVSGNMCAGVVGNELMVRVGPDAYADALDRPRSTVVLPRTRIGGSSRLGA